MEASKTFGSREEGYVEGGRKMICDEWFEMLHSSSNGWTNRGTLGCHNQCCMKI